MNKSGIESRRDSFESLREKHWKLFKQTDNPEYPALLPEVRDFMGRTREAGLHIWKREERDFLNTILSFWGSFVYEHSEPREYPPTDLHPLDPEIDKSVKRKRMRKWAAVAGPVVLVLLAGIMFAPKVLEKPTPTPMPSPTPTITPTPTPVAPSATLVVAQFENRGSLVITPTQFILERLGEELTGAGIENVRLESAPTVTNSEEARELEESRDATLVIWGWFNDVSITPNFEIIKEPWRPRGTRPREIASEPESFPLYIGIEEGVPIPEEMAYFSAFTTGQIYYRSGQYEEASLSFQIALLDEIPEEGGENVYLYAGLANFNLQEYQLAIEVYSKTLEVNPDFAEAYNNQGLAYAALGDYNKAIADYTEAISITNETKDKFAVAYNNRGLAYAARGDYDRAITDYDEAIRINSNFAEAYNNRGLAYADKAELEDPGGEKYKLLDSAIDDFDQALLLDSYFADAYFNRGNVYYSQADLAEEKEDFLNSAIEDYTSVIKLNPNDSEAYYKRGVIYRETDKKREAINDFETFLGLVPDDPRAQQVEGFIDKLIELLASMGKIAFRSDRDGNREIYVMDGYGFNQTRLTKDEASDALPAWSPDGRQIAFASDRDGDWEIYVMNSDSTELTGLTNNEAEDWTPAWSPDGRQIAFASDRDGDYEIYIMDIDGGNLDQLTDNSDFDIYPAWSPDGSQIAFVSNRDGNWEVYVMNSDGSNLIRLTNNEAGDWDPAWSPDGSEIAFASDRDGDFEIYAMNSDGTDPRKLTDNEARDDEPAWSQ